MTGKQPESDPEPTDIYSKYQDSKLLHIEPVFVCDSQQDRHRLQHYYNLIIMNSKLDHSDMSLSKLKSVIESLSDLLEQRCSSMRKM